MTEAECRELADVLAAWDSPSGEHFVRLPRYLSDVMGFGDARRGRLLSWEAEAIMTEQERQRRLHVCEEDVPLAVELRDGGPVSELSQAGVAATSGAAFVMVV